MDIIFICACNSFVEMVDDYNKSLLMTRIQGRYELMIGP